MLFADALAYLDRHIDLERTGLPNAGDVEGLSLTSMRALVDVMGDPHRAFRSLHVSGTNGKGTVAHLATAVLAATGLHVGTYTSPHVSQITERIRSNGVPVSPDDFAEAVDEVARIESLLELPPSYFEILTAAAYSWFAHHAVDVAVVEVGMLGRYDATNVLDADVSVITSIGKDHTDGTGDWAARVAHEKAGIVRPGHPLVLGPMEARLVDVFAAEGPAPIVQYGVDTAVVGDRLGVGGRLVDLRTPRAVHEEVYLPLHGAHQSVNLALAVAAVEELLDAPVDTDVIRTGLSHLSLPGRCEVVHRQPVVILDGAHNADAARRLVATLDEEFAAGGRRILVVGMLRPRDPAELLEALAAASAEVVVATTAPTDRGIPADEIAAAARSLGAEVEIVPDPVDAALRALVLADEADLVVVAGTFYTVGAVREPLLAVRPEAV